MLEIIRANPTVTLVYAARDEMHNSTIALKDFLHKVMKNGKK